MELHIKTASIVILALTWCVRVYHLGTIQPPAISNSVSAGAGRWISKDKWGINQLIVEGTPYERGYEAGRLTEALLYQQETVLVEQLNKFFPSSFLRQAFLLALMRWFWGGDKYFDSWMLEEMLGVSQFASKEFDYLADGFTRQVAYHGLHEVGQMLVDQEQSQFGCTVFAVPAGGSWVIGRNFDFEAGRIFDEEKILKWVFPKNGYAFVSIIWAGMVGAVTGVNEHGVYISINAAGSKDFARYGTPSTLVLLKALQFSKTAEEAKRIIEESTMFITDIFVVADTHSLYRVEKSPKKTRSIQETKPTIITNHLVHSDWAEDEANENRKKNLTTLARAMRGEILLQTLAAAPGKELEKVVLSFLRDKKDVEGNPLTLGNRKAIDGLIATHANIYNTSTGTLYVSQGPAVSGAFVGFDLKKSFSSKTPVVVGSLPKDKKISGALFNKVRKALLLVSQANTLANQQQCEKAGELLRQSRQYYSKPTYNYHLALGNTHECQKEPLKAKEAWRKAQSLFPAYASERIYLRGKLQ